MERASNGLITGNDSFGALKDDPYATNAFISYVLSAQSDKKSPHKLVLSHFDRFHVESFRIFHGL